MVFRENVFTSFLINVMEIIYYFFICIFKDKDFLVLKSLFDFNSVVFVKWCVRKLSRFYRGICLFGFDLVNLLSICV